MAIKTGKKCYQLNLLALIVAASCSSQVWAAAGDICVDDGAGTPDCAPIIPITTNGQDIDTGTNNIITNNVTASGDIDAANGTFTGDIDAVNGTFTGDIDAVNGTYTGDIDAVNGTFTGTVQGDTLTDGAGTTINSGDVTASGTIEGGTLTDGAGTTITGGDVDADTGTIDTLDGTTATFTTFDDGTVTLSGGALSDGTNSITMDGADATVDLNNGNNALTFDNVGASMSASDGTTTGSVDVTDTQASVTVDNGTATHGLTVGTTDTVLSGGTTSTTLTLDDAGAHLDNTLEMGNNRITNLADGINPLDAVNKRQLDEVDEDLQSGIAAVAAIASIPAPIAGHRFSIGIGGGFYEGESAIAAGFNANITDNLRMTGGVGSSSGETVSNVGFGFSW